MSRRVQMLIGAGLAALLLWLFLRGTDLAEIGAELRRADYRWVLVATLLTLFANVQRAWRWRYLLMPIKTVGVGSLTSAIFIGWAFTALLPGRLGEVVRPVLIGRREDISKTAAFATVVLERLFDLLTVLSHELGHVLGHADLDPHAVGLEERRCHRSNAAVSRQQAEGATQHAEDECLEEDQAEHVRGPGAERA